MRNHFFAMISRMKYIERWSLMRNSISENISEHSLEVAMLAHALAVIGNRRLGKKLNAERAALIGIYHDATEIITGDMPTPIKYHNKEIIDVYKKIEDSAARRLIDMLPEDFRRDYEDIFFAQEEDGYLRRLVKAADKISALIKCTEEGKAGNGEFRHALSSIEETLKRIELPEVDIFLTEFFPAYSMTLDELN